MQPETNVIPFPIVPRKPADHSEFPADRSRSLEIYLVRHKCIDCGHSQRLVRPARGWAAYCSCGAEMRPVEGK